jgi:hypothetical protein
LKDKAMAKTINCSNTKCSNKLTINKWGEHNGHEMGPPSGYADDYVFCDKCAPIAENHFDIASYHDGGMMSDPACEGKLRGQNDKPHTCPFTEEERNEAMLAFDNYR